MKSRVTKHLAFAGLLALLALSLMSATGSAQGLDTNSTALPPPGQYVSPTDWHTYAALGIIIDDPSHDRFNQIVIETDGDDELESFQSTFSGTEIGQGFGPIVLFGGVQVRTTGIAAPSSDRTGAWDTEILSMDLSGNVGGMPVEIQESPVEASTGQTTITDIGGGNFHIDSFFDVFTEIRAFDPTNGWSPWFPSDGSTRMTLTPEPGSLVLLGMGALGFLAFLRRRKRAA